MKLSDVKIGERYEYRRNPTMSSPQEAIALRIEYNARFNYRVVVVKIDGEEVLSPARRLIGTWESFERKRKKENERRRKHEAAYNAMKDIKFRVDHGADTSEFSVRVNQRMGDVELAVYSSSSDFAAKIAEFLVKTYPRRG